MSKGKTLSLSELLRVGDERNCLIRF